MNEKYWYASDTIPVLKTDHSYAASQSTRHRKSRGGNEPQAQILQTLRTMEGKILTYQGAVQTWECDSNDHMNVMYYINKFELAGRNLGFDMGTTMEFLKSRNWGIAVVEQNIQYLREVVEDDLLKVESCLTRVGNKSFSVYHEMSSRESGELVSIMKVSLVLLDKKARKAVPIPPEINEKMQALIGKA